MITTTTQTESRITHSSMQCAKTCLRKHFLNYKLGLRPDRDAKPLRIGSAIHEALYLYKRALNAVKTISNDIIGELIHTVISNYDATAPSNPDQQYDWAIERATISALLAGYFWRWGEMDQALTYHASELQFDMPIVNPETGYSSRNYTVAGKLDGIVALADNRLAVIEHKTTSDDLGPESDYWKRLRIDAQISLYYLAAQHRGYDVQTVYYDVIRKPTIKPCQIPLLDQDGIKQVVDIATGERIQNKNGSWKQAVADAEAQKLLTRSETPEEYQQRILDDIAANPDRYYARREIPRMAADLEEFQYELWQMTGLLHDCNRMGRWPRNTSACIGFGKCQYFDLCTGGYDINSHVVPEGFTFVENVHSELEGE